MTPSPTGPCLSLRGQKVSSINWHKLVGIKNSLRCYCISSKCNARPSLAWGHELICTKVYYYLELDRLTNNTCILFCISLQNLNLDCLSKFQDPGLEERFNLDEMSESLEVKSIEI